ncbi:hypothetical protein JYU34_016192, partial [Plutella xylostella]
AMDAVASNAVALHLTKLSALGVSPPALPLSAPLTASLTAPLASLPASLAALPAAPLAPLAAVLPPPGVVIPPAVAPVTVCLYTSSTLYYILSMSPVTFIEGFLRLVNS